jgi:hypothetical protein
MNTPHIFSGRHGLAAALLATFTVLGCGGGGGASSNTSTEQPTGAAVTPMNTLVVPETMTWSTANDQAMQVAVVDANDQPVADAGVTMSTVMRTNPHDATPLTRPVAMDRIDQTATGANGLAALSARVPAHLTEVMIEASKGALSARKVLTVADLAKPLTLKFE